MSLRISFPFCNIARTLLLRGFMHVGLITAYNLCRLKTPDSLGSINSRIKALSSERHFLLYGQLLCTAGQMTPSCQFVPPTCCDAVFCRTTSRCTSTDDVVASYAHPRHCACVLNAPASGLTPVNHSARSVRVRL